MYYVLLTKLEYPASVSLKVKGLREKELESVCSYLKERKINYSSANKDYLEIDITAVEMLNLLCTQFGYKVYGQSMAMENSTLGSRSFQIEKITWTLGSETQF